VIDLGLPCDAVIFSLIEGDEAMVTNSTYLAVLSFLEFQRAYQMLVPRVHMLE
jgi:hypothetical protein